MIRRGHEAQYQWIQIPLPKTSIGRVVVPLHEGCRVAILSFDSGRIQPCDEERQAGWTVVGSAMVSPPLRDDIDIPEAGYDEWYVFETLPDNAWAPQVFVNYGSFTLAAVSDLPPDTMYGWDWLPPLQEEFWNQLREAQPVTFVAVSDWSVTVVSRRRDVIDAFAAVAPASDDSR